MRVDSLGGLEDVLWVLWWVAMTGELMVGQLGLMQVVWRVDLKASGWAEW